MRAPDRKTLPTELQKKLRKPLALFLDFDGTLVPIVARPEQAWLSFEMRLLLKLLSKYVPLAIVSGRSLRDIRFRIGLDGVVYAGNHGLEISGGGLRYRAGNASRWRRLLKTVTEQLRKDLSGLPGIIFEDKNWTLSIHYRLTRGNVRRKAARIFAESMRRLHRQTRVKVSTGKAVWEILPPVDWDKGSAVQWILRQPGFRGRWPLYIGDDKTDQDVFRAIRKTGLGIAVGARSTKGAAHHVLKSPREVRHFLRELLDNFRKISR